ncbi:MAG: nickel-dependent lactate racemase [Clostridiales bacterium]|nr:nickel-dependent lactate racemase [Clostridiales bacterium]
MSSYHFKYGDGAVDIALPETGRVEVLRGAAQPALGDIGAALRAALERPIGGPALRDFLQPNDQVTLIVSDMSRFWMRQDLVIPHLVDYMRMSCGVAPRDIVILVANGTHIGGDEAALRTLVTDAVYDAVKVVNHDCEADDLAYIGTTGRGTWVEINPLALGRKVVALGAATQHVMAGYGGGRKSILPGICSLRSIRQNHAHSLDPCAPRSNPAIGNAVLGGNPLHEDMCEAAAMVEHLFVINLVMSPDMKLARITCGHFLDSWLAACRMVDEMYAAPIREKADVIIAGCGGYPKDMSLYQCTKTIDNVESGLKPGGTLVLLAECRDGGGPAEYFSWIDSLRAGTLDVDLRAAFTIPGYIFYLNCEQARRYRIMMLTAADAASIERMGMRAYGDVGSLLMDLDLAGKLTYVIPNGSTVVPTLTAQED